MEIVKTIIPHNRSYIEPPIPSATEWLANMSVMHVSCLTIACVFVAITFLSSFFHLFFVLKYVSNERIRNDMYALIFMFPITTFASLVGMFIPRAAIFLYAVSLVYFMFTLFIMVTLLFNIFGGRQEMSAYLLQRNIRVNFTVPPLCFFKFLPTVESTDQNLRRIEWLVFQTPIIRTLLELVSVVVSMEQEGRRESVWFVFSQLMALLSMCIAFYGCYVMVPLGREKHAPYRFDFLFRTCDIAQCIYTIQKFVFEFAAAVGLITSDRYLPAAAKALWWASFMCTWEMMLLSALCSYCLRPAKCKFFDLYPGNDMPALSARDGSNSRVPSFSRRLSIEYEPRIAGVMLEPPSRSSLSITPRDKIEDPTTVSYFADNFDSLSQIQGQ
ncbi:Organic solute transporter alpha-like protein 1 [Caenorhabditis elegans]|uniref:Organic solute transporter alpha-like protein 1 n=1 Tax=Caenorhabditis elegans TaxID=6239 RepID=OSTA1_CAEEL|nr:Organic solute transporter alpha-like protein 1 [Caenorhabditis elegans]O17204.2 RecName: Full=Organic solute transporter alpha-like protein 1; AltName: Full=Solute carrier family 51 subunit alpha homolog C [Caenorhabditis elegans]CCD61134.1 Organic solute transporter alpha-like protein 1 [Caenorhabditis elegans]|eukprot:NP_493630.2 Organic solute transporter alpha-like protein 1 [Caenorhabditis elegans]